MLTGDPDQNFDTFSYSYPEIGAQNLALQAHFQHILQFEDKFEEAQVEDQPLSDQIEEPGQPQPPQPQQL